jgi:hypothetical protein
MYNLAGWRGLFDLLGSWGVDTSEFRGCNDGDVISQATCQQVAEAIEQHLPELDPEDQDWLQPHIVFWRNSGGFEQW